VVATLVATLTLQAAITIVNYRWQLGPDLFRSLVSITQTRLETRQGPARGTGTDYVYERGSLLRGTGAVGPGNAQAKFIVALLPLALASFFLASSGLKRALCLGGFGLSLAALYLTFSRGGLLTGLLGTGLFLFLRYRSGYFDRKAFVTLVVAGLVGLGALVPYLVDFLMSRPGYFQIRLDHMSHGLRFAAESPLLGVGVNNFNVAVRQMDHAGVFDAMPIHNHYLRLFIETGTLGLILHLSFLLLLLRQGYRLIRVRDPFLATTAMALVAGVVAILVYWSDDIFYDVIIRTEFWILLGLILVVRRLAAEEEGEPSPVMGWEAGVEPWPKASA
jgi:O-antigen ligase